MACAHLSPLPRAPLPRAIFPGCPRIAVAALHVLGSQVAAAVAGSMGSIVPEARLLGITAACGAVARSLVDFALARPADAEVSLRVISSLLRQNDSGYFKFRSFARAPPAAALAGDAYGGLQPPWGAPSALAACDGEAGV